jgi:hypothetical protein
LSPATGIGNVARLHDRLADDDPRFESLLQGDDGLPCVLEYFDIAIVSASDSGALVRDDIAVSKVAVNDGDCAPSVDRCQPKRTSANIYKYL